MRTLGARLSQEGVNLDLTKRWHNATHNTDLELVQFKAMARGELSYMTVVAIYIT